MTVGELKKLLNQCDDDMEVCFKYPSGDYWRTDIAGEISQVDEMQIKHSDYHDKNVIDEDGCDDGVFAAILS